MKRKNLQKLSTFLAYGKKPKGVRFDMGTFSSDKFNAPEMTDCGTVGCSVGLGTFVIKKRIGEWFTEYSERVFINKHREYAQWIWCFAGEWDDVDNTKLGAAKRIQYLLDNGLPEGFVDPDRKWKKFYKDTVVKKENESSLSR